MSLSPRNGRLVLRLRADQGLVAPWSKKNQAVATRKPRLEMVGVFQCVSYEMSLSWLYYHSWDHCCDYLVLMLISIVTKIIIIYPVMSNDMLLGLERTQQPVNSIVPAWSVLIRQLFTVATVQLNWLVDQKYCAIVSYYLQSVPHTPQSWVLDK